MKDGDDTVSTKDDDMGMRDIVNKDASDSKAGGEPEASDMQCQTDMSGHGSNSCSTDPNPYTPYTPNILGVDELPKFHRSFKSPFSYPHYQTTPTDGFPYSEFVTPPPLKRPRTHAEDDNLSDVGSSCFLKVVLRQAP